MTDDIANDDDDDEPAYTIEVSFVLRPDALSRHGIAKSDLDDALSTLIDEREAATDRGETPPFLEDMLLHIGGATYRCGEFFEIEVRHNLDIEDQEERSGGP
jgi:hypothetical protein